MKVRQAPRFVAIAGSEADPEGNAVRLLFRADDDQLYAIELEAGIIPALLTATTGHANELASIHGGHAVQALPAKSMDVAMTKAGDVGLTLLAESGLRTVFSFSPEQHANLQRMLSDLADLLDRTKH